MSRVIKAILNINPDAKVSIADDDINTLIIANLINGVQAIIRMTTPDIILPRTTIFDLACLRSKRIRKNPTTRIELEITPRNK